MARFFPLEVADIRRETRDAVVVTLAPRPEDRAAFDFTQGQYLTFRRDFEGEELLFDLRRQGRRRPQGRYQARRRRRLLDLGQ
jgi:ferredoxin-NADP reductase